jgi:biotin carboxyl carrier protein
MNLNDCDDNTSKSKCRSLLLEGSKYRTFYNKKFENRQKWEKHDPNKLKAFIPGTIVKVSVKAGQKVKRGQQLLILDAMKMKNIIFSPINGVVKLIDVKEGQRVPKGYLMAEVE